MNLDLDEETGELTDADIYSERLGYTLSGEQHREAARAELPDRERPIHHLPCAEGAPDWSIAGGFGRRTLDGYGYLEGGKFQMLDWPVMWLPRAAFPVYPRAPVGLSHPARRLLQPARLPAPATLLLGDQQESGRDGQPRRRDLAARRAARRVSLRVQRAADGEFQFGYFNEAIRGRTEDIRVPPGIDPEAPENRWGIIGHHLQGWDPSAKGYVDLLLVGDNLFLREMNTFTSSERQEVELRTLPFTTSRVGVVQDWGRIFVQGQRRTTRIWSVRLVEIAQPTPTEACPGRRRRPTSSRRSHSPSSASPMSTCAAQKLLGFGLMGDLEGSFTNFQRNTG